MSSGPLNSLSDEVIFPFFSRDGGAGILLLGQRSHLRDQQKSGGIKIGWRYKVCGQEVTQMAWLKKASCDPSSSKVVPCAPTLRDSHTGNPRKPKYPHHHVDLMNLK